MAEENEFKFEISSTPSVKLLYIYPDVDMIKQHFHYVYKLDQLPREAEKYNNAHKLFKMLLEKRHSSVLEFIDTVWYIECSRVASHQIVRHRIASYFQESQRYVKPNKFIIPRYLLDDDDVINTIKKCYETYLKHVEKCKDFGEDYKQFYRYVLPNATATRLVVKYNLRELIESFIPLRICIRAQPEIRYIAIKMMLNIVGKVPKLEGFVGCRAIMFNRCPERSFEFKHQIAKCLFSAVKEAIYEHGTSEEMVIVDKIAKEVIKKAGLDIYL